MEYGQSSLFYQLLINPAYVSYGFPHLIKLGSLSVNFLFVASNGDSGGVYLVINIKVHLVLKFFKSINFFLGNKTLFRSNINGSVCFVTLQFPLQIRF